MSRIVVGLKRTKLIHIQTDESDRRAIVISATDAGVRLMQRARTRRVDSLARALSALPEAQLDGLRRAAEMIDRLSKTV